MHKTKHSFCAISYIFFFRFHPRRAPVLMIYPSKCPQTFWGICHKYYSVTYAGRKYSARLRRRYACLQAEKQPCCIVPKNAAGLLALSLVLAGEHKIIAQVKSFGNAYQVGNVKSRCLGRVNAVVEKLVQLFLG